MAYQNGMDYQVRIGRAFKDGGLHNAVEGFTMPWLVREVRTVPGWLLNRCIQSGIEIQEVHAVIPESTAAKMQKDAELKKEPVTLESPVAALELGTRLDVALEEAGAKTVNDLLSALETGVDLTQFNGIGKASVETIEDTLLEHGFEIVPFQADDAGEDAGEEPVDTEGDDGSEQE